MVSRSTSRKLTFIALACLAILIPFAVAAALVLNLQPLNPPGQQLPQSTSTSTTSASSGVSTSTLSAQVTQTVSGACENATEYTGIDSPSPVVGNSSASFPILSMQQGETATICVSYVSSLPVSEQVNVTGGVTIGNYVNGTLANGTVKAVFAPSSNFTVTPEEPQTVIGGDAGQTQVVAFTVKAAAVSRGFYFLNIQGLFPVGCDNEFRFAVGYIFTSENASGQYFALPPGFGSCTDGGGILGPGAPAGLGGIYSQVYATQGLQITSLTCSSYMCDLKR